MKKIYNVIWFDDQYSTLEGIQEKAHLNNIKLYGFSNAKDGIEELEKNLVKYDAAIVDGLFYKWPGQTGDTTSSFALFEVGKKIVELQPKKVLDWFILSGQTSFTKEKHLFAEAFKNNKVYDKNKDEDLLALWKDLKEAADKQPLTQIRHRHQKVFDVCSEYIGEEASKPLMDILLSMENPYGNFDDKNYFNALRQIVELFFRASYRLGILHSDCINEKGELNVTNSKSFMSGKNSKTKKGKDWIDINSPKNYFPEILASNLESILIIANAGSHPSGKEKKMEKPTLSEYKKQIHSNYLLYSTTFQVMDLLLWFKKYADDNHEVEKNKLEWNKVE